MSGALTALALILWAAGVACIVAAIAMMFRGEPEIGCWFLQLGDWPIATGDAVYAVAMALEHQWFIAAWFVLLTAWVIWSHHHNRRKRKRAPALFGYKARARLAAVVRKAREATKPRPVLRPVPGGAR